jgi:hypothetical protein
VYENGHHHHSTDPESDSDGERRRDKGKARVTTSASDAPVMQSLDAQTQRLVERMQHLRMLS